jgi:hypothetical protein
MQYRSFNYLIFGLSVFLLFSSLVSFSNAGQLIYSTYLGGSNYDEGNGIVVDGLGNAYIIGITLSMDFPATVGAFDTSYNGDQNYGDVFVSKLNASGTALDYSTYLGGDGFDQGNDIAVDSSGNAYITGETAGGFPTTPGAFDTLFNGGYYDVFVSKLNSNGTGLVYSTYLGGEYSENSYNISVDTSGNAYITGYSTSTDFPTTVGAFDTSFNGYTDVFVTKLNASGTALVYSTYLGGENNDYGQGIAIDGSGNAYITGYTRPGFPTTPSAFDTSFNGTADVFVTKLNPSGSTLVYSTFLGGEAGEEGRAITVDESGNAYITGGTDSPDFPTTPGTFDTSFNGYYRNVFVSKLNASGTAVLYSTFLGYGEGNGIAVDGLGNAYITGYTNSSNFPTTPDAFDTLYNGGSYDVFVSKLNTSGTTLCYSTYLGGVADDYGNDIAIDNLGNTYITGRTRSNNFPTTPLALDTSINEVADVIITKMSLNPYSNYYSEFTDSYDTNYWYFEKYGDGIGAGTLLLDTTYGFAAIYQSLGEKGKLTQMFSVPSTGWYTAQAKVWTSIADPSKQQKVYLYLQELDNNNQVIASGNQVIQAGSGYFSSAWNPKDMLISFYAQGTKLAVQLVAINPANSGEAGSLCIDYIRVTAGVEIPLNEITLTNQSFDDGTTGWLLQPYGDAPTAGIWTSAYSNLILAQDGGNKGKASQLFSLPTTGQNVYASAWIYSDVATISNTQKVYLYLYDYSSGYNKVIDSGNMILQPGKWSPGQWHQLQFVFPASTNNNAVQLVGINPDTNSWAGLYFDDIEIRQ